MGSSLGNQAVLSVSSLASVRPVNMEQVSQLSRSCVEESQNAEEGETGQSLLYKGLPGTSHKYPQSPEFHRDRYLVFDSV